MDPVSPQYGPSPVDQEPNEPSSGWRPQPPPPPPYGGPGTATPPRGRTGLTLIAAVVIELIIIAAIGNQWLSGKVSRNQVHQGHRIVADLESAYLTYSWRFSPVHGDHEHFWLSQLMLVLTTIVLSALLILAVVRGSITFGRAFFGTWLAVIVATQLGAYVRALVIDDTFGQSGGRGTRALFGELSPNSVTFFAGLALGLVVALLVALVAIVGRRPAVAGYPAADPGELAGNQYGPLPEAPPPFFGDPPAPSAAGYAGPGAPPWQDQRYGPPARHAAGPPPAGPGPRDDTSQTAQLPPLRVEDPSAQTTRLPEPEAPPSGLGGVPTFPQHRPDQPSTPPPGGTDQQPTQPPEGQPDGGAPAGGASIEQTTQLPRLPAGPPAESSAPSGPPSEQTTQLPRQPAAPPAGDSPAAGAPSEQTTQLPRTPDAPPPQQFPRPPDDEELGHIDPDRG
jgi:hypothetical protein